MTSTPVLSNAAEPREGLECLIGRARVAIPIEAVQQVIEYEVSPPPPLSRKWVGGLGLYMERVVVSVALVTRPGAPTAARRTVKGVLLQAPGFEVAWALEVSSIAARVRAQISPRASGGSDKLPEWMANATTSDRRAIGWIDVEAMLEELSGGPVPV